MGDQRGGIAILTALGFLLFSIPLITASLDLAQNSAIDARVKTDITHRQYCGLAVQEYLDYLVADPSRWGDWLSENVDPGDPTGATSREVITPCGKSITITSVQQTPIPSGSTNDPVGNPLSVIPPLSAYGNRNFQTSKTISDTNPLGGAPVTYTLTIVNRDSTSTTLNQIEDTLPPGFVYDCDGPANLLTLPGAEAVVTLTFNAITSIDPGTYYNEFQVGPGGNKTRSGKTAIVQVGILPGLCPGEAVRAGKTLDSVSYISTDEYTSPYTCSFTADYSITIENIGTDDVTLKEFIDLLPVGFSYVSTSQSGDIIDTPHQLHHVNQVDRQRITWKFNPEIPLASGTSKTLTFTATAAVSRGYYWSDLLVDFGGGTFSEDRYSWPTALVSIIDSYNATATDEDGNKQVIALEAWISNSDGIISTWNLE
jgi:uncharacterized repeat protein (TIGR01451 family)